MIKKIYFQSIFFSFLFSLEAFAAESGGMPQLNPEFWVSQIFWLILTFGILYIVLSKLILPKISNNLETRKSQILENIEAAEKQREDSETKLKEYEEIISKSKLEAKNIFNQAREKALKDINAKREVLDKQIDEEISKAEEEINTLRKSAPEKINTIAIKASSDLIQKLIGAEVNNSSISAIVDDLSKEMEINIMAIDATFWVAVSFIIFFGALIYLKIPQKITEMLDKMISDIKNEIDESEKLRTDAKTLLDNAQNKLDTAQSVSSEILEEAKKILIN
jgi:F-type H+-transporting ATPase subunit b